jgi:hypothetical protein
VIYVKLNCSELSKDVLSDKRVMYIRVTIY